MLEITLALLALASGVIGLLTQTRIESDDGTVKLTKTGKWIGLLLFLTAGSSIAVVIQGNAANAAERREHEAELKRQRDEHIAVISQLTKVSEAPFDQFELEIRTGTDTKSGKDAGTNGAVYAVVHGADGDSVSERLDTPKKDDFKEGKTDQFYVRTQKPIGTINAITITWEPAGESDGAWFLESVAIHDLKQPGVTYGQHQPAERTTFTRDAPRHRIEVAAQ